MRRTPAVTFLIALLVSSVASAAAQVLRVSPAVALEDDPLFGARLTLELDRGRDVIGPFPRSWHWGLNADAPVYHAASRNPETLRARLDGGLQVSLFRPSAPVGPVPSPDDPPPWDYGFVAVGVGLGAEAPQRMTTADLTLGGVVAYEHSQYQRLWFLPELRLGYDAVFCIDCELPQGSDEETGSRLDGEIRWSIPADRGWVPAALRPLWLRLLGRGFQTFGLEEAALLRNEEGLWGAAELAYRCDRCGPLHEVFVRGHGGRLPQRLREKRVITGGVSIFF